MVRHNLPFADLSYGFIGHLTYVPSEDPSQGPGRFHTTRRLEAKPTFRVLPSTKTWLPADRQPPQEPTGDDLDFERAPWKRVKSHHSWLYFREPEAYAGVGESVQPLLTEGENLYMRDETSMPRTLTATPLLAIGSLSTPSQSKSHHRVGLLATAAGTTGETLRLTRIRDLQMGWRDGAGEDNLILHDVDLNDPEDHTTWTGDAQPISKIKSATNDVGDDRIRRLLVQKPDSTTIFRPEYRAVPVASDSGSIRPAPPSRIVANKLATITIDMTGGNYHSDVAFNGGYRGVPQQIAIVDERGYWSIWDAARVRHRGSVRATVGYRCFGHIDAGIMDELPSSTVHAARPHGILFVGYARDEKEDSDDGWEDDARNQGTEEDGGREEGAHQRKDMSGRSDTLLIWNEDNMSIVDVPTGLVWPKLDIVSTKERILDVQHSPRSKRHVLVLTTQHIIWLDLLPAGSNKPSDKRVASILIKSPHNIDPTDSSLHLTACRERYPLGGECVVTLIYSTESRDATMYWFWHEEPTGLAQFHRQTILHSIEFGDKATPLFQTLSLLPCKSTPSHGPSSYAQNGVRFHQLLAIGKDLSVHSTVCASFVPSVDIQTVLPPDVVIPRRWGRTATRARKRKQYLKHLGDAFVVPDELGDIERGLVGRSEIEKSRPGVLDGPGNDPEGRPVVLKFRYLGKVLEQDLEAAVAKRTPVSISVLFEAILHRLQEARDSSSLMGLTSLLDLVGGADLVVKHDFDLSDWNDEVGRLYDMAQRAGGVTIIRKGPVFQSGLREERVNVKTLYQQISAVWLGSLRDDTPDAARSQRERLVRRMTVIMALSSYGVMVGPTPLSKQPSGSVVGETRASRSDIAQRDEEPSSSQTPSRSLSQARKAAKAAETDRLKEKANDALARLRALAGLPRAEPGPNALPQHPVLALWPDTPAVPLSEYVSSVKQASGMYGDAIRGTRERQARREAKKARLRERYGGSSRAPSVVSSQMAGTDWETEAETEAEQTEGEARGKATTGGLPFRDRGGGGDVVESRERVGRPSQGQLPSRPMITSSQPRLKMSSGRQGASAGVMSGQLSRYGVGEGMAEGYDGGEAQGSSQPSRAVVMSQPVAGAFGARPKATARKVKGAAKIRGFR